MDEKKKIEHKHIINIAANEGFNEDLIEKDYYLTKIIYLLKDVKGIYFKGGTALQKIFLNYSRLSEDADYTLTRDVEEVKEDIIKILKENGFEKITSDKNVKEFVRLIAHYKKFDGRDGEVFIDLNKKAKLHTEPEKHNIPHFYKGFIPDFKVSTLSTDEMIGEKMAASIGRNKPRDHFDIYMLIKKGYKINIDLAKKKCIDSNVEFDIVKMFNKARKLKNRWDEDMIPLLNKDIEFYEIIKTLSDYFNLKEEKENKKNK